MGQRVFTLDYDGSDLKTWRAPFAPDAIDPQRIVADLQFAYWPLPALKSAWQIGETQVIEPRPGLRRLIHGDRIVAEVHSATADRFPARLWLVNFVYGYRSEEHTSELQSLMRISSAVFCLKKKKHY